MKDVDEQLKVASDGWDKATTHEDSRWWDGYAMGLRWAKEHHHCASCDGHACDET